MIFGIRLGRGLPAVAFLLVWTALPGTAQVGITHEDVNFRFGIEGQFWGDWTQDGTAGNQGYQQNLYLRRARLIVGGDIGEDVSFFIETDSPNLGKTPKSQGLGFILQDAFLEWKPTKVLQIDSGLFFVPLSRNALQSTLSYYGLDLSVLSTINNTATQSIVLRDLGMQARGFFLNDHLLYRVGLFQGERDSNARNSLRVAGYVQYDFLDTETGYVFTGTALGKKKILAIDGGTDWQGSYRGISANAALDLPVRGGDEIGGQFQFLHYDGRRKFLTIRDQNDWFLEAAYYVHRFKFQPFTRFESQQFVATVDSAQNLHRAAAGVNYYVHGQNLKWTAQYSRTLPGAASPLRPGNEFTMQLQIYYF